MAFPQHERTAAPSKNKSPKNRLTMLLTGTYYSLIANQIRTGQ